LELERQEIELKRETILTSVDANKGRGDPLIQLPPFAVERLQALAASINPLTFPWNEHSRTLWSEFGRIQAAAVLEDGLPMPKGWKEGRWYGFHDLRRGFATVNAAGMNLIELQSLRQHQSLTTTQGYVNMAERLNTAVHRLFVPQISRIGHTG